MNDISEKTPDFEENFEKIKNFEKNEAIQELNILRK